MDGKSIGIKNTGRFLTIDVNLLPYNIVNILRISNKLSTKLSDIFIAHDSLV